MLAEARGHGYELNQRLVARSGGELTLNEGSLCAVSATREEWRMSSAAVQTMLG